MDPTERGFNMFPRMPQSIYAPTSDQKSLQIVRAINEFYGRSNG